MLHKRRLELGEQLLSLHCVEPGGAEALDPIVLALNVPLALSNMATDHDQFVVPVHG